MTALDPTVWTEYRTRQELDHLAEEYVDNLRAQFARRVAEGLEEHFHPAAWSHWPRLERDYRAQLHAQLDQLWAKHARRTSGLS